MDAFDEEVMRGRRNGDTVDWPRSGIFVAHDRSVGITRPSGSMVCRRWSFDRLETCGDLNSAGCGEHWAGGRLDGSFKVQLQGCWADIMVLLCFAFYLRELDVYLSTHSSYGRRGCRVKDGNHCRGGRALTEGAVWRLE